jgi:aspartyl/asparaginyl-tRNA synthetase
LQSEHERWLTEKHFKSPVTVFNYPKEIKPFYMRLNDDDKTVTAMDVLVPGIGATWSWMRNIPSALPAATRPRRQAS